MKFTVATLAKLAGISVRTLHYYDEIGLLKPTFTNIKGYRFYENNELYRLQHIMFFKELGFSLKKIMSIMCSPVFLAQDLLRDQKELLIAKKEKIELLINLIEKTMKQEENEGVKKPEELFNAFKDEDYQKYKEEVVQRWGNTQAYTQSVKRMSRMTKTDVDRLKKEGEEIIREISRERESGPGSQKIQILIKKHYQHINQFYDCSYEMYRSLGKMYVEDSRFTAYYERFGKGLAVFVNDAVEYFCDHA